MKNRAATASTTATSRPFPPPLVACTDGAAATASCAFSVERVPAAGEGMGGGSGAADIGAGTGGITGAAAEPAVGADVGVAGGVPGPAADGTGDAIAGAVPADVSGNTITVALS